MERIHSYLNKIINSINTIVTTLRV